MSQADVLLSVRETTAMSRHGLSVGYVVTGRARRMQWGGRWSEMWCERPAERLARKRSKTSDGPQRVVPNGKLTRAPSRYSMECLNA